MSGDKVEVQKAEAKQLERVDSPALENSSSRRGVHEIAEKEADSTDSNQG